MPIDPSAFHANEARSLRDTLAATHARATADAARIAQLAQALQLALPYVQKAASAQPTTPSRTQRRDQARHHVKVIESALVNRPAPLSAPRS